MDCTEIKPRPPRWEAGDQASQPTHNYYHMSVPESTQCYLHFLLKKKCKNICLSIHPSIHSSIHLSVHPSFRPSIHPSIHLSIYLPIIRRKLNHLKIIQEIPDNLTWKARIQVSTENSHIGHSTQVSESANVKVRNVIMRNKIKCTVHCYHRTDAIWYTLKTWSVSGI